MRIVSFRGGCALWDNAVRFILYEFLLFIWTFQPKKTHILCVKPFYFIVLTIKMLEIDIFVFLNLLDSSQTLFKLVASSVSPPLIQEFGVFLWCRSSQAAVEGFVGLWGDNCNELMLRQRTSYASCCRVCVAASVQRKTSIILQQFSCNRSRSSSYVTAVSHQIWIIDPPPHLQLSVQNRSPVLSGGETPSAYKPAAASLYKEQSVFSRVHVL